MKHPVFRPGFTLIEVTLSIVVGIILIAGATLLYNQAKVGAGNARAKAKVLAFQAMVEEVAANAGGTYPFPLAAYNAWVQRHPDDYNQSPWGGPAGWCNNPDGAWGTIPAPSIDRPGYRANFIDVSANGGPVFPKDVWGQIPTQAGDLLYYGCWPPATASAFDMSTGNQVTFRNYWVSETDPNGDYFWFVSGGK